MMAGMAKDRTAAEILQREYLEIRCRLLDIAASLDRIQRGREHAGTEHDARLQQIRRALLRLAEERPERAEEVQMIFSDPFE